MGLSLLPPELLLYYSCVMQYRVVSCGMMYMFATMMTQQENVELPNIFIRVCTHRTLEGSSLRHFQIIATLCFCFKKAVAA